MTDVESIQAITVSLEIDGKLSLFVLLADDGTINRMGTGSVDNQENDLYIGVVEGDTFLKLRSMVDPEWFAAPGRYEVEKRAGPQCELTLGFSVREQGSAGVQFVYGAESEGPPREICEFVSEAVNLTAEWTRRQKAMVDRGSTKPWWRFW